MGAVVLLAVIDFLNINHPTARQYEIYVMAADGTRVRQVTNTKVP